MGGRRSGDPPFHTLRRAFPNLKARRSRKHLARRRRLAHARWPSRRLCRRLRQPLSRRGGTDLGSTRRTNAGEEREPHSERRGWGARHRVCRGGGQVQPEGWSMDIRSLRLSGWGEVQQREKGPISTAAAFLGKRAKFTSPF